MKTMMILILTALTSACSSAYADNGPKRWDCRKAPQDDTHTRADRVLFTEDLSKATLFSTWDLHLRTQLECFHLSSEELKQPPQGKTSSPVAMCDINGDQPNGYSLQVTKDFAANKLLVEVDFNLEFVSHLVCELK